MMFLWCQMVVDAGFWYRYGCICMVVSDVTPWLSLKQGVSVYLSGFLLCICTHDCLLIAPVASMKGTISYFFWKKLVPLSICKPWQWNRSNRSLFLGAITAITNRLLHLGVTRVCFKNCQVSNWLLWHKKCSPVKLWVVSFHNMYHAVLTPLWFPYHFSTENLATFVVYQPACLALTVCLIWMGVPSIVPLFVPRRQVTNHQGQ